MSTRFLVLLLAALLAHSGSVTGQGAEGDEDAEQRSPTANDPPRAPTASKDAGSDDDDDDDDDDDGRGRGRGRSGEGSRAGPGLGMGDFGVTESSNRVTGDFVSFTYSHRGIQNASVEGGVLFSIEALDADAGPSGRTSARGAGSTVRVDADAFRVVAHDNPNALFTAHGDDFRFSFPADATLASKGKFVQVTYADGRTARVFGDDVSVVGPAVLAEDRVSFMLEASRGAFDVHRSDISRAVAERTVGAEVTLGAGAGSNVTEEIVTFGNVSVTSLARPGNVTLYIDGEGFDGRVVVVNVDPGLFKATKRDDFAVLFDNVTMREASSLVDVLDPDDDGLHPEYWFVQDADGYQIIASFPHYSVHTLSLTELIQEVPPSIVAGVLVGAVAAVAGAAILFRGPRR